MVDSDDIAVLSTLHERLVEALAGLDRAGRHAAAAHLVAAIEMIEDDLGIGRDVVRGHLPASAVALIASQMCERFGARATGVARRQLADATGPTLLSWAAIVNRIPT